MKNHDSFYQNEATIRNGYFFYDRMATDYNNRYAQYYNRAEDGILSFFSELSETTAGNVSTLTRLWQVERQKEITAFNKFFGINTSLNFDSPNIGKELISAYNYVLQLKNIYNRNKALFTNPSSEKKSIHKGLTAYFPTYFNKAWNANKGSLGRKFKNAIEKGIESGLPVNEALNTAIEEQLSEVYKQALIEMFGPNTDLEDVLKKEGNGLSNEEKQQFRRAYNELAQYIDTDKGNWIINSFKSIYNLNGITRQMVQEIEANGVDYQTLKKMIINQMHASFDKESKQGFYVNGGLANEVVTAAQAEIMFSKWAEQFEQAFNGKNVTAKVFHSGQKGLTPDIIMTIGVEDESLNRLNEQVKEIINETQSNEGKSTMIKDLSKLGEALSNTKDSLIIYVNNKLYSLNDNFSGYSAGTARNLKEFLSNIPNEYNINGLLTAAINTTKDSLNTPSAKEAISGKLASLIAFYLFDDYVTLGNQIAAENQGFGIHLMYLNNTYVPLSVLLQQLDQAIQAARISYRSTVNVSINIPEVKPLYNARTYGKPSGPDDDSPQTVIKHWTKQRNSAQRAADKITIKVKFFQNMKNIIAGLTS